MNDLYLKLYMNDFCIGISPFNTRDVTLVINSNSDVEKKNFILKF